MIYLLITQVQIEARSPPQTTLFVQLNWSAIAPHKIT